jgi:PAS domain S-box-containing protein
MQAGADDYLVKPFTARELLARVNAHVSISRTRRDAAEKERQLLAEAEAERRKLRDLFEQAPAAIGMMTGPEHVWTYLNPQYVRLLGRSHPGELLNRRICDTLPEIGPQGFIDLLDRVYRTGERYVGVEVLAKLVTPSGDTRDGYFDFVYQPIRGADGAVEGIMVHSVEVTDKVLARKEVEQKQELLLAALNASATGTFRWDPATDRFEHFDDNLKQLFGIPQDEAVTTTAQWLARIHPNDRRGVEASLEHCRDGADFEMEYRVPLPGGRVRWIYDRAKAFQKDGTLQFVGACTDITSARELTEQLRALNDIGQRIAAELDPDKLLQLITDVATQHTGAQFGAFFYNVEDSERGSYMLYTLSGVDRSHFDKFPMPRNTDVFAPTFEGAPPVRSANIRKDPRYGNNAPHHGIPPGHLPVVSYLAASVKGKEGHVIGGLFFGHSSEGVFTERDEKFVEALASQAGVALENARLYRAAQDELERRRKIELELEQQREFLVLAQKSANVGSWQLDLTKNPITATWSEELQVLYGYKPGTFEGSYGHWVAALHPDDRESAPQSVMDAIAKHEPWMREFRIIRRDGAIRWMSGSGQCYYDEAGNPKRMIGVNMDITERKIAEDALRNSEKLAATGRLAATIAHEINNPLEAITNLIFLARRNRDVPDSVQRHLELADRELDRVSHIAQQTLGFYRDTTAPVIINVQEAVRDVLRLFERKLEYKNLSLKSDVPANMDIQALRGEIRQVLSNLIANAIEASSKGGRVLIRARHIKSHGRDAVRISVSDCGHGIPANLRSSVFMPFFTTKKDVGTGLGLWVTKSMVEKHGGTIRFRSTEGHGTVFSIVLPARMSGQNHQSHTAA